LPTIVLTYAQLKALQDAWSCVRPVNWTAYDEAREIIRTAPLDDDEVVDEPTIGEIHTEAT